MIDPADREPTTRERLEALDSFTRHPGWRWFFEAMNHRAQTEMNRLVKITAEDANHAPSYAAAFKAYQDAMSWPASEMEDLQATLEKGERDG